MGATVAPAAIGTNTAPPVAFAITNTSAGADPFPDSIDAVVLEVPAGAHAIEFHGSHERLVGDRQLHIRRKSLTIGSGSVQTNTALRTNRRTTGCLRVRWRSNKRMRFRPAPAWTLLRMSLPAAVPGRLRSLCTRTGQTAADGRKAKPSTSAFRRSILPQDSRLSVPSEAPRRSRRAVSHSSVRTRIRPTEMRTFIRSKTPALPEPATT